MAIDWTDPCARADALRRAYYEIVATGGAKRIRFSDREVWFSQAELATLKAELLAAENECAASNGGTPKRRRFAIRAGSRIT